MANIMTKRGTQDNVITYEHYCDAKEDLVNIPKSQITLGSTAVVLKDENNALGIYIAGSDKEWVSVAMLNEGSSGGGAISLDFIHICGEGEYDSQTLEPTIDFPEENVFYLVPNSNSTGNLFDEWIYINDNWEKFGIGQIGATGATPQLSIGTVSTGAANSNATVNITGTAEQPVLNFSIPRGSDGHSPVLTSNKSGTTVTIFSDGTQLAQLKDGSDGQPGAPGADGDDGTDGTTFTPAVSSAGVISWTNDGGKTNPQSVDLVAAVIAALPVAGGVSF